jgi:hypothetical protein
VSKVTSYPVTVSEALDTESKTTAPFSKLPSIQIAYKVIFEVMFVIISPGARTVPVVLPWRQVLKTLGVELVTVFDEFVPFV